MIVALDALCQICDKPMRMLVGNPQICRQCQTKSINNQAINEAVNIR